MNLRPYFSLSDFRGRLVLVIFTLSLISLALLIVDRIHLANRILYEREQYRINVIGALISGHVADCLETNDLDGVRDALRHALLQRDVRVVSILDSWGQIAISSDPKMHHALRDTRAITPRDTMLVRTFPLSVHTWPSGAVQVGLSLRGLDSDRRHMIGSAMVMFIIMAAAILLAALLTATLLMRPLMEMKVAADRIAGGDFSARVPIKSGDTIGQLAAAIDSMAAHLDDLTAGLQKRIDEATVHLREKSEQLQASNRKLLELDQLKSDFVSMVSHELRTPLTSIIGFARTLQRMDLPPDQIMRYLGVIESEGRRLAGLVREYLDITRIESGRLDLMLAPTHWSAVVDEALNGLDEERRSRVCFDIPQETPLILADVGHLRRALLNLIDNALKYSPPSAPVRINVENGSSAVVLRIADQGPGISAGEAEKVFDKFYRGADYSVRCIGGTGLGLSIVKGIVEAHNGAIWFETSPRNGTVFFVQIPTVCAENVLETAKHLVNQPTENL